MELDMVNGMNGGNTTLAWLAAVALAAGGTAIVVTLYLQWRRWRGKPPLRKAGRPEPRIRPRPVAKTQPVVETAPEPSVAAPTGVAAYRIEQTRLKTPPRDETPLPDSLDDLLGRLRSAAESLEALALRSGQAAGSGESYQAFLTGLDVEYLHRQS